MKYFKSYKLFENKIEFQEEYVDYHHGQHDAIMNMWKDGKLVAYATYSNFNNKIKLKYIESLVKGKGYGIKLMKELAKRYGYENLERGSLTPSGAKMRKKLDKHFNFNYEEYLNSLNKHIDKKELDKIKNEDIKQFLLNLVNYGFEKGWEKSKNELDIENLYRTDINEIGDISEWIKGSKENDNITTDEPPSFILNNLKKLQKYEKLEDLNLE